MTTVLFAGIEAANLFFLYHLLIYYLNDRRDTGSKADRTTAIRGGLIFLCVVFMVKGLWLLGLSRAFSITVTELFRFSIKRLLYLIISGITLIVIVFFRGMGNSPAGAKPPVILFAAAQLIAAAMICISIFSISHAPENALLFWLSLILSVALSFLILFFNNYTSSLFQKELEDRRLLSRIEDTEKRMREVTDIYASLHSIRHDLKRHLQTAEQMMDRDVGKQYLDEVNRELFELFSTGCLSLDALLTVQAMQMKRNGIRFEHDLCSLEGLPLNDVSLCSIIGNLLENAAEAVEKLNASDSDAPAENTEEASPPAPFVSLQMRRLRSMLFICCKNPYQKQTVHFENGLFLSDKKTPDHGQGMKIIRKLSHEAGGTFTADANNGLFTATVMLPYTAPAPSEGQ